MHAAGGVPPLPGCRGGGRIPQPQRRGSAAHDGRIEEQLRLAGSLRLTARTRFPGRTPFFTADYLDHLRRKPLDASLLKVFEQDGRINVRVEGPWQDVILWEIPVLAIISEMRNRFRYPQFGVSQALARLDQKLDKLERELSPAEMQEFNLIDFGTRRRFSHAVQDAVVGRLQERLPAFHGTSNYQLGPEVPAAGGGHPGPRVVPGPSAARLPAGAQPARRPHQLAG